MLFAGMALALAGPAAAKESAKPVLFIHGIDPLGEPGFDCDAWDRQAERLRGMRFTGTFARVAYYFGDTDCGWQVDHHGSHDRHYGDGWGHSEDSHDADTRIEHLGYHFAWFVYSHFTNRGKRVDVVAHSMGGLITRYALAQVARNHPDFPPNLDVQDIVTQGTPHRGSAQNFEESFCQWATQCDQMDPGSDFLDWMAQNAKNPQGRGGTQWTAMGSRHDERVPARSTVGMRAARKVIYRKPTIGHSDYRDSNSTVRMGVVDRKDRGSGWRRLRRVALPATWTGQALRSRRK
jgi:pimeloyl-ACP methyl ester carboxylesterase